MKQQFGLEEYDLREPTEEEHDESVRKFIAEYWRDQQKPEGAMGEMADFYLDSMTFDNESELSRQAAEAAIASKPDGRFPVGDMADDTEAAYWADMADQHHREATELKKQLRREGNMAAKRTTQAKATEQPKAEENKLPAVQAEGGAVTVQAPKEIVYDPYIGASLQPLPAEIGERLLAPIDENDVEIRPDGAIYYPEIKYRKLLNSAIGPMGWAIIKRSEINLVDNVMSQDFALFIHGRFVSEARGECDYIPTNKQMTYPMVLEGVKSNALMRTCKDLGIASECWDPNFIHKWIAGHAVQVWVQNKDRPQWRRIDRPKFYGERGPVDNADQRPAQEQQRQAGAKNDDAKPASNGAHTYEITDKHKELKTLLADWIDKNCDPEKHPFDYYYEEILSRLSTWKDHPGVRSLDRFSPKMVANAIEDVKKRNAAEEAKKKNKAAK